MSGGRDSHNEQPINYVEFGREDSDIDQKKQPRLEEKVEENASDFKAFSVDDETVNNLRTECDRYKNVLEAKLAPLLEEYNKFTVKSARRDSLKEDIPSITKLGEKEIATIKTEQSITSKKWHYLFGKNHDMFQCTSKILQYHREIKAIEGLKSTLTSNIPSTAKIKNFKEAFTQWIHHMGSRVKRAMSSDGKRKFVETVRKELKTSKPPEPKGPRASKTLGR